MTAPSIYAILKCAFMLLKQSMPGVVYKGGRPCRQRISGSCHDWSSLRFARCAWRARLVAPPGLPPVFGDARRLLRLSLRFVAGHARRTYPERCFRNGRGPLWAGFSPRAIIATLAARLSGGWGRFIRYVAGQFPPK